MLRIGLPVITLLPIDYQNINKVSSFENSAGNSGQRPRQGCGESVDGSMATVARKQRGTVQDPERSKAMAEEEGRALLRARMRRCS